MVEKSNDAATAATASAADLPAAIDELRKRKNAVILAHYYTVGEVQDVADFVGDSLALARQAARTEADIIVMCGVHFMGETCKLLCPTRKVLVPDLAAGCSLADSCPADEFGAFVRSHPGYTVLSYVNTTAAVKQYTDIVVTSGNARQIVESLPADEKIIFGPDRNLGSWLNAVTGRNMLLWDGACHVHEQFSAEAIIEMKKSHPRAKVLVHPECKRPVVLLADVVGSTAALLSHVMKDTGCREYIVATEPGIIHEMQQKAPGRSFYPVPPETTEGLVGCGCNECAYMRLNTLEKLYRCLLGETPEIRIDPDIMERARRPIDRMLEFNG